MVARSVQEAVHSQRRSMKQVVNNALRSALLPSTVTAKPYRVAVHHATLQPGLDVAGFNRLADELEDEDIVAKIDGGS